MVFIKSFKKKYLIFLLVCISVMAITYLRVIYIVPGSLTLLEGQDYVYNFKSPFFVNVIPDKDGIIKLVNDGEVKASKDYINLSNSVLLKTQKNGSVNLSMRLFGLIPLRTMQLKIVPNKRLVACGNTIGVRLKLDGILVIGMSDIESLEGKRFLPARDCGVKAGDLILEANKRKLKDIDDFVKEIDNSNGNSLKLKYKHGENIIEKEIIPVKSIEDKKYHIGLWVRDSTAGIGTLTFYDPETKCFGALGHGIADIDTGTLMPIESGEILQSNILAIKKGQQGNPGELKGVFVEDKNNLGTIKKNCDQGIYGVLNDDYIKEIPDRTYQIGLSSQVKEGQATILANIDGKKIEEYNIEIQKVAKRNIRGSKGMVIKITDKKLLEATGGIVQGMSGSPIIQNDRIIGAVTHVLVNDPARGYGTFIEWMLENTSELDPGNIHKAS
jgi:stage IV sporulation protein B